MFQILKGYWLHIILGIICIFIGVELFLFYFFLIYLITSERRTAYLRRLIRINHIANEVKIVAIMNKLDVTPEDASAEYEKMLEKMTDEAQKELEDDFSAVFNFSALK